MPNTPALVGMGVTGLAALPGVDAAGRELASNVLGAVGLRPIGTSISAA